MEALSFEDLLQIDGGVADKDSAAYQVGHAIGEGIAGAAVAIGAVAGVLAIMAVLNT